MSAKDKVLNPTVMEVEDEEEYPLGLGPGQSSSSGTKPPVASIEKREVEKRSRTVDPDTNEEIPNPKRPRLEMDEEKKRNCLELLLSSYYEILEYAFTTAEKSYAYSNVDIASQITSILFVCHNYKRQEAAGRNSNLMKKSQTGSFKVNYLGKERPLDRNAVFGIWEKQVKAHQFVYQDFEPKDAENWYGTIAPYLEFFGAYALRRAELRMGHSKFLAKRDGEKEDIIKVASYGLYGAHHILLEGITYPPERKSSMAQSVGPMTAMISYMRSSVKYEEKWKLATKRAFGHINCIDDIMSLARTNTVAAMAPVLTLLGNVTISTTGRQAQRMNFPINLVHFVYTREADKTAYLKEFNVSGRGGFYTYNAASSRKWRMNGEMTEEQCRQVLYHCVFGTYKEDLNLLAEITNVSRWYTREELGSSFQKASESGKQVNFDLVKQIAYSKLASSNQTGLLSGNYAQTTIAPVFSGERDQQLTDEFFERTMVEKTQMLSGKSIPQVLSTLTSILQDILPEMRKKKSIKMGTTKWRRVDGMSLLEHGPECTVVVREKPRFFMGRS